MIEVREAKWVLKSNEIFQIIEQGNPISERTLDLKKYVIKSSEISKRINDDIARGYNMNLSLYYDKKTVPVRMINLKEGGKDYMATKKRKNKLIKILCCFGFLW